jgi:formylglycine-generating enzyme required for sulfatase activity
MTRYKTLRGGSWYNFPGLCRSACRFPDEPDDADFTVGFRIIAPPSPPSHEPS